jgi:hypothetical protein
MQRYRKTKSFDKKNAGDRLLLNRVFSAQCTPEHGNSDILYPFARVYIENSNFRIHIFVL